MRKNENPLDFSPCTRIRESSNTSIYKRCLILAMRKKVQMKYVLEMKYIIIELNSYKNIRIIEKWNSFP